VRVKRPVIIPHSRLRGASLRRRRPRWTLRTALSYIFPPKHTNKYGVTKHFRKYLHFQNPVFWKFLPFFGALAPYFEPPLVFPRLYPTFTSNVTHTPPWKNTQEKVESPRLDIATGLLLASVQHVFPSYRWAERGSPSYTYIHPTKSPASHTVNGNAHVSPSQLSTFTFTSTADATVLPISTAVGKGGRSVSFLYSYSFHSLQLHTPLTVMSTSPLHTSQLLPSPPLLMLLQFYQSPRLLVKVEAYDSASNISTACISLVKVDGA